MMAVILALVMITGSVTCINAENGNGGIYENDNVISGSAVDIEVSEQNINNTVRERFKFCVNTKN